MRGLLGSHRPSLMIFGDKHDFSQDQGIEKGKPMHLVVNAVLAKKKALVKNEQRRR